MLFAFAALWLVIPKLGHVLFFRPITTNYIYSVVLFLAYFIPMRLDVRMERWGAAVALALGMLAGGFLVGMLNEHTGPALALCAVLSAALALRQRRLLDALWRGSGALGIILGSCFLFFAPGQRVRYGKLGRQSVLDTIAKRGVSGNWSIVGSIFHQLLPLLIVVAVLFAAHIAPTTREARIGAAAAAIRGEHACASLAPGLPGRRDRNVWHVIRGTTQHLPLARRSLLARGGGRSRHRRPDLEHAAGSTAGK